MPWHKPKTKNPHPTCPPDINDHTLVCRLHAPAFLASWCLARGFRLQSITRVHATLSGEAAHLHPVATFTTGIEIVRGGKRCACDILEQCVLGSAEHKLLLLVYKCLPMMLLHVSARENRDVQTRRIEQNCTKFIAGHRCGLFLAARPRPRQDNQTQQQQQDNKAGCTQRQVATAQECSKRESIQVLPTPPGS